jgi:hypothetical protein
MKQLLYLFPATVMALSQPVLADDPVAPPVMDKEQTEVPFAQGLELLRGGAELLLQDLFAEIEPALDGMAEFALELEAYDPPVVLPNGDILIRRKSALEPEETPKPPKIPRPPNHIEIDPMPDEDFDI